MQRKVGWDSQVGEQAFEQCLLLLEATPTSLEDDDHDHDGGDDDDDDTDGDGDDDVHQQRADPDSSAAL